jgi:hypothetical protein
MELRQTRAELRDARAGGSPARRTQLRNVQQHGRDGLSARARAAALMVGAMAVPANSHAPSSETATRSDKTLSFSLGRPGSGNRFLNARRT